MSFRFLLAVFAAAHVIGGLACVIAPTALLGSFGVTLPPMGLVIYQFWGAALAAVGLTSWLFCGTGDIASRYLPAIGLAGFCALSAVIAVWGQAAGANASGRTVVISYAFFALAFLAVAVRARQQGRQ